MGKGASSSSSSANTTTTTTSNLYENLNNSVDGDLGLGIQNSSNVEVVYTDHDAVRSALLYGEEALTEARDFGEKIFTETVGLNEKNMNTTKSMLNDQVSAIQELAKATALGGREELFTLGVGVLIVIGLVLLGWIIFRRKG